MGLGWFFFCKILEERNQVVGHTAEHAGLLDISFKDFPDEGAVVLGVDGDGLEGGGPGGFVFVEVGGVVNEWECPSLVDKAELGDEAHGAADGGGEGVVGGGSGGQGAVDVVGDAPIRGVVVAAFPSDAEFAAEVFVGLLDAAAFHAAKLGDRDTAGGHTGTTEFIGINGATTDELWQLLQDEVAQLHNWYDAEAKNGNLSPRTDEPQIALVRQRPAPDEDGDYAGLDDWPIIADWK